MDYSKIDALMKSDDSSDRRKAASMLAGAGNDAETVERLVELLKDSNSGVRDASESALMFLGGRSAVEQVIPLVAAIEPGLRNTAIDILRKIGDDGIDVLHGLAGDKNDDIRLFVLDILGTIGNPESVDVLIGGLKDTNPNVRNAAVVSLGLLGHPKAFEHIKPLIEDEEWIRFSAIEALSQIAHENTPEFLLEQLDRWAHDELMVSALLETIGKIRPKQCVNALIALLENTTPYVENELVKALLQILAPDEVARLPESDSHIIKTIIDAHLTDAEEALLYDMLQVLSRIGDRASVEAMVELARITDPDTRPDRVSAITKALSRIADLEAMITLLDDEDRLKTLAANVLAGIGKEEGAKAICERIFASQGYVKRAMTDALGAIGGSSLREVFHRLLEDSDGHVISSALRALGRIGDARDIGIMEPFLSHRYLDVRDVALVSIVAIDTKGAEEVFLRMTSETEPARRILGLNGISLLASPRVSEVVSALLTDKSWEVRAAAVKAARDRGLPVTLDMLKSLLIDEHEQIRYAALDIAGLNKVHELRQYLDNAITGQDMWAASHAIEALGRFRDGPAKARLLDLLTCDSDFMRISAIKTIALWEDEELAAEIEPYLDDPNPDVARAAMDAIDRLQGVSF